MTARTGWGGGAFLVMAGLGAACGFRRFATTAVGHYRAWSWAGEDPTWPGGGFGMSGGGQAASAFKRRPRR